MLVITMSAASNTSAGSKAALIPKRQNASVNNTPVTASTTGYCHEIGVRQYRQTPRNSAKERSGMASYPVMGNPHAEHAARGDQRLRRAGRRAIATVRK